MVTRSLTMRLSGISTTQGFAGEHSTVLVRDRLRHAILISSSSFFSVKGKHSTYIHFTENRNCEICQRTIITRAPCRRRNGGAVPHAENFGDLISADHKVFSDYCESRNNHRYAVVVQDLVTQWIQAYPCKNKIFTRNTKELAKVVWSPRRNQKSFTLTIHWNSAKLVKISPGIIARLHHTDRLPTVLPKGQCAE